jgi:hypothetical protein
MFCKYQCDSRCCPQVLSLSMPLLRSFTETILLVTYHKCVRHIAMVSMLFFMDLSG